MKKEQEHKYNNRDKKIVAARVGCRWDRENKKEYFGLEFKLEDRRFYWAYSREKFDNKEDAEQKLKEFNEGKASYVHYRDYHNGKYSLWMELKN